MNSNNIICLKCKHARFPDPKEQCYKWGGLICTVDNSNVGKYDRCKFTDDIAEMDESFNS